MASIPAILPGEMADGIWTGAERRSAVLGVAQVRPQKFGQVTHLKLTAPPKAEIVAAGGAKSSSGGPLTTMVVPTIKAQTTVRFDQELQWADEDHQLGVLQELSRALEIALAEQIDYAVIHRTSVLQGTVVGSLPPGLATAGPAVESNLSAARATDYITSAAGQVITAGYSPTGVIIDAAYAFSIASASDTTGRPLEPNFPLTGLVENYRGLRFGVGQAVSGRNALAGGDSYLRAVVGDFSSLVLGLVREVPVRMITSGDPDGLGDLNRYNQVALRAEMAFGFGIFDPNAFARITDAAAD